MFRIFIGYDPRESIAYHVLSHSILSRASGPVSITPLVLNSLRTIHKRERDPLQSTDFTYTRFLVPYLCEYSDWALFMDCDMLVLDDVYKLCDYIDPRYAVRVVKHQHRPPEQRKFFGAEQTRYPRKNWSSVMLFNCGLCRALTPEYVDHATGAQLHQFDWLPEVQIGELPRRWNHLVGYDDALPSYKLSLLHWTTGGPWIEQYKDTLYSDKWRNKLRAMGTRNGKGLK